MNKEMYTIDVPTEPIKTILYTPLIGDKSQLHAMDSMKVNFLACLPRSSRSTSPSPKELCCAI
jgi:hypothetical protein